jgi:hypothetical protein
MALKSPGAPSDTSNEGEALGAQSEAWFDASTSRTVRPFGHKEHMYEDR